LSLRRKIAILGRLEPMEFWLAPVNAVIACGRLLRRAWTATAGRIALAVAHDAYRRRPLSGKAFGERGADGSADLSVAQVSAGRVTVGGRVVDSGIDDPRSGLEVVR
jgi:hypothetical protein